MTKNGNSDHKKEADKGAAKPLSLAPLSAEEVLRGLLEIKPVKSEEVKKKATKKRAAKKATDTNEQTKK